MLRHILLICHWFEYAKYSIEPWDCKAVIGQISVDLCPNKPRYIEGPQALKYYFPPKLCLYDPRCLIHCMITMATSGHFVTIKFNERTHKLSSEAEGQIILADDDGNFFVEDFSKCYVVNGEVQATVPETSNMSNPRAVPQPIGLSLSY